VFEKVGGFSEDYFMYSEDVDICRKIWSAGYEVLYLKNVMVVHYEGKSSFQKEKEVSEYSQLMMMDSRFRYFKKYNGNLYAGVFRFLMLFGSLFRLVLLSLMLNISGTSKKKEFHARVMKWKAIFSWCAGFRRIGI
jgi:hypothetical protein